MNAELKQVLGLVGITGPLFALLFVAWLNTPMYKEIRASQQRWAIATLELDRVGMGIGLTEKQRLQMVRRYGLDEHSVNMTTKERLEWLLRIENGTDSH